MNDLEQQQFMQELEVFEAPYLMEKLLRDQKFSSKEEYQLYFSEFKRYVYLAKITPQDMQLAMLSDKVDEVWHQFILFTREYMKFCDKFLGRYLHHMPNTSHTRNSQDSLGNFRMAYTESFGTVPENIWNFNRRVIKAADDICSCGGCCDD